MNTTQSIPRSEYPRPQFVRESYINLNGTAWTFEFDHGKSGMERKLNESKGFDSVINVPFCPESELSGVQHTDFIDEMYYHRELNIPAEWKNKKMGLRIVICDSPIFVQVKLSVILYKAYDTKNNTNQTKDTDKGRKNTEYPADDPSDNRNDADNLSNNT